MAGVWGKLELKPHFAYPIILIKQEGILLKTLINSLFKVIAGTFNKKFTFSRTTMTLNSQFSALNYIQLLIFVRYLDTIKV